jgi:hypothetical protein
MSTDAATTEPAAPTPYDWVRDQARVHVTWGTGTGTQAEGVVVAYCAHPTLVIRRDDGEQMHVALASGAKVTELPAAPAARVVPPVEFEPDDDERPLPTRLTVGEAPAVSDEPGALGPPPRDPEARARDHQWPGDGTMPRPVHLVSECRICEARATSPAPAVERAADAVVAILYTADDGPAMMAEVRAVLADLVRAAGQCCDLHNEHCEPPSELCCGRCTEWDHPRHPAGVRCTGLPALGEERARVEAKLAWLNGPARGHGWDAFREAMQQRREPAQCYAAAYDAMAPDVAALVRAEVRAAEQRVAASLRDEAQRPGIGAEAAGVLAVLAGQIEEGELA